MASGLVYFPVTSCTVMRTSKAPAIKMAAGETRAVVVRGLATDLSSQGGSASGCGTPVAAESIAANLSVSLPDGSSRLRAWASDQSASSATLVAYVNTTGGGDSLGLPFNNATILDLCLADGCSSDFKVRTQLAGAHVRIDVIALWRYVEHGVLPQGAVLKA